MNPHQPANDPARDWATLLDEIHAAVSVHNLDDRVVHWNRGAERLYGWQSAEVLGRAAGDLFFPGDRAGLNGARSAVLEHGEWAGEVPTAIRSGLPQVVRAHWTLLRDERGRPLGTLSLGRDATDEPGRQVERASEARLDSLGRLADGVAHDLNNILTPLLMAVQLLRKELPAATRGELLDTARAGVARGVALVRRLLVLSGRADGERESVRLEAVVEEVRAALERGAPRGVDFRAEIPPRLSPVLGDAGQLTEALRHLGENARDAVAGGGTVTFSVANAVLTPADLTDQPSALPGRFVVLAVTDTGAGIAADVRDRIFDPFFTTKPFGRGAGLGLSLARGVVRAHGGFIRVETASDRGSRFSIYLPAADAAEPPAHPVRCEPRGNGETVLVVDDEAAIARLARLALEGCGYAVLTAGGGAEAVELFTKHRDAIRVVVLDQMMPEVDGRAALKALRGINPGVRVIAASGRPSNLDGGVQGFLAKPYDAERLVALVREVGVQLPVREDHGPELEDQQAHGLRRRRGVGEGGPLRAAGGSAGLTQPDSLPERRRRPSRRGRAAPACPSGGVAQVLGSHHSSPGRA